MSSYRCKHARREKRTDTLRLNVISEIGAERPKSRRKSARSDAYHPHCCPHGQGDRTTNIALRCRSQAQMQSDDCIEQFPMLRRHMLVSGVFSLCPRLTREIAQSASAGLHLDDREAQCRSAPWPAQPKGDLRGPDVIVGPPHPIADHWPRPRDADGSPSSRAFASARSAVSHPASKNR